MNSYITLLRCRPYFRNLWLASVVSLLGDWFNTIATVILVSRYTNTGLAVSGLFLARTLPQFLFGPVAGVVADRFNRKLVMVISDIMRAGIVLSFLWVDRPERVWLIYLLTALQLTISTFFNPASSALLPSLVEGDKELLTSNVLSSITWSAMLAIGAALGGGFSAIFGVRAALIVDAITFLVSALLVSQIYLEPLPEGETQPEPTSGWADFIAGLRYLWQHKDTLMLTTVKALGQIGASDIIITVYAERLFSLGREGAGTLGLLYAAAGVGAVLGPVIGNRIGDGSQSALKRAIQIGFILMPLGWLLVGWAPTLLVVAVGFLLRAIGGSVNWTYSSVLIQMQTPDKYLGRVFSFDMGFFTLGLSISLWLSGQMLDSFQLDPRTLTLYFSLAGIVPVAIWFISQRLLAKQNTPVTTSP
ncbi:MAG: MFS transporter [Anaerolineales bacterium]|nr:MFS transporter [Anaerolineales bacterium]